VNAFVSPDGARLLVRRNVPTGGGHAELRYSIMPFAGGSESPLGVAGVTRTAFWVDSVTVGVSTQTAGGLHLAAVDVRTGAQRNAIDVADSVIRSPTALPDGWAWIAASSDRIVVSRGGHSREYPKPPWYAFLLGLTADPAHQRLFFLGSNTSTGDSLGVATLSLADGATAQWTSMFGEGGHLTSLPDGSAFLVAATTQESLAFFKLTAPGQLQRLGGSARDQTLSVSDDLTRGTVQAVDYRADAWLSKVVRQ